MFRHLFRQSQTPWKDIYSISKRMIYQPSLSAVVKEYATTNPNARQSLQDQPGEASGNVVAVGDDDGMVILYRFPAPLSRAKGKEWEPWRQEDSGHVLLDTHCLHPLKYWLPGLYLRELSKSSIFRSFWSFWSFW